MAGKGEDWELMNLRSDLNLCFQQTQTLHPIYLKVLTAAGLNRMYGPCGLANAEEIDDSECFFPINYKSVLNCKPINRIDAICRFIH